MAKKNDKLKKMASKAPKLSKEERDNRILDMMHGAMANKSHKK